MVKSQESMNESPSAVEATKLLRHSLSGVKWTIGLSALVMPLSYVTNLMLWRTSTEALGVYGLLVVLTSVTTTFLFFGGNPVLVRFIPELPKEKRLPFVLSYVALSLGLAAAFVVGSWAYPEILSSLLRRDLAGPEMPYLVLLVPIVVLLSITTAILQADLALKEMAVVTRLTPLVNFVGVFALHLTTVALSKEDIFLTIATIYTLSLLLPLTVALRHVVSRHLREIHRDLHLFFPPGFWTFAGFVHLSTLVVFVIDSFDQLVLLNRFDVEQLGLYRASLVTAQFVRWLPLILTETTLPMFTHLFASQNHDLIPETYERIVQYGALATSLLGVFIAIFAQPILLMFGQAYVESSSSILVILASVFILSALSTVNSSVIVANRAVRQGMTNGLIGSVLQIGISLSYIGQVGPLAVAVGKAFNLLCITVLNAWLVFRMTGLRPPRRVVTLFAFDALIVWVSQVWAVESWSGLLVRNSLLLASLVALILWLRMLRLDDGRGIIRQLGRHSIAKSARLLLGDGK